METKKILAADLLDLLFENRNKDYGAYELRKTYNKRITTALLITASVTVVALGSFFFANGSNGTAAGQFRVDSLSLENLQPEEKTIEPPPPPPPPMVEPPPIETAQFTPPRIVKDNEVDPNETPPVNEDLENTKIDVVSRDGVEDDGIAQLPDQNRQVIEQRQEVEEDKIVEFVQIEASFPGGDNAWKRFLEKKLNPNTPVDNGAPEGQYQVWVQFIVDKTGAISDVKALSNHGYGMEEEAVNVIRKGPNWIPAIQNGKNVKAYRKQSILFIVQGSE